MNKETEKNKVINFCFSRLTPKEWTKKSQSLQISIPKLLHLYFLKVTPLDSVIFAKPKRNVLFLDSLSASNILVNINQVERYHSKVLLITRRKEKKEKLDNTKTVFHNYL